MYALVHLPLQKLDALLVWGICVTQWWFRRRWARTALGLVVGAVVGLVVYQASRLTGRNLYILSGAVGGATAAAVVHGYSKAARLTDVTLTIPQFSELHFTVTKDSRLVAWKLFVETVTRVSTQPIETGSGLIREALTSLYGLFDVTRQILKQTQPSNPSGDAPTVEELAITMLNLQLRPFLARWHPALHEWEKAHPGEDESAWPDGASCRAELVSVQQHIRQYAMGYAKLAGVYDATSLIGQAVAGEAGKGD